MSSVLSTDTRFAPWHPAQQLVVVISPSWQATTAHLHTFVREDNHWQAHNMAFEVAIGRNGSAWGVGLHPPQNTDERHKCEGDGRSPAGIFAIGSAFGYAPNIKSAWPYRHMQAGHYCMDVLGSPLYNQIVDSAEVGAEAITGSTEPMRLDLHKQGDERNALGFVIAHNPYNILGKGSCIFAHLWQYPGQSTAGCTAMSAAHMNALLAWFEPSAHPHFVLLPHTQYQYLYADWCLPTPDQFCLSHNLS